MVAIRLLVALSPSNQVDLSKSPPVHFDVLRVAKTTEALFEAMRTYIPHHVTLDPTLIEGREEEFRALVMTQGLTSLSLVIPLESAWVEELRAKLPLPLTVEPPPRRPPPPLEQHAVVSKPVRKPLSSAEMVAELVAALPPGQSGAKSTDAILIVDSNAKTQTEWGELLYSNGHQVLYADSSHDALVYAQRPGLKLIIIHHPLRNMDGLVLCADLKTHTKVPILVVSQTKRVSEGILALKLGAEDFVERPFSSDVFLARVDAILKRHGSNGSHPKPPAPKSVDVLTRGNITLNMPRRKVAVGESWVTLTATEFRVLKVLMDHFENIVTRADLAEIVWGYSDASIGRSIDVHVHRLRSKLKNAQATPEIISVRGYGYQLKLLTFETMST